MTKILITIQKPDLTKGISNTPHYQAIRTLPFGIESGAYPVGDDFVVEIKGRRSEQAFQAATSFMENYPGEIFSAFQHSGKRVTDLMPAVAG